MTTLKPHSKNEILQQNLFGNALFQFQKKPLFIQSFLKCDLVKLIDIWDNDENNFKKDTYIYEKLKDKRNCIAEFAKIKKSIPNELKNKIRINYNTKNNGIKLDEDLCFHDNNNRVLDFKKLKPTLLHNAIIDEKLPNCQIKWEIEFNKIYSWNLIWENIKSTPCERKVREFQWKSVHNILYTESRLNKMKKTDGKCHFCKIHIEDQKHLFYYCEYVNKIIIELDKMLKNVFPDIETLNEEIMIIGFHNGNKKKTN